MEKLLPIQIQLLDRLSRIKEPVSSQFLANSLGVSSKTIRKNLNQLNEVLSENGAVIESKTGSGYWLTVCDRQQFERFSQGTATRSSQQILNPVQVDRTHLVIRTLLCRDSYTRIEELEELLFMNLTSVKQILNRAREILRQFDLKIVSKSRHGMKIVGREHDIRLCLNYEYGNYTTTSVRTAQSEEYGRLYPFDPQIQQQIELIIRSLQEMFISYNLSSSSLASLSRLIILSAFRSKQGHPLEYPESTIIRFTNRNSYYVAKLVLNQCTDLLQCRFIREDIILLAIGFVGFRIALSPDEMFRDGFLESKDIAFDLVQHLAQTNLFSSINKDIKLVDDIALHLDGLFTRSRYHLRTTQFASEVQVQCSLMSKKMAMQAMVYLHEKYEIEISEEEITRLALVIHPVFGRFPWKFRKIRACCVSNIDKSVGRGMAERLMRNFGRFLEQIDVLELYELKETDLSVYEILFTSYPAETLNFVPKTLTVFHLDLFFDENTKRTIRSLFVNGTHHSNFKIRSDLRPQQIFTGIEASNEEACFKMIGEALSPLTDSPQQLQEDLLACEQIMASQPQDNVVILSGLHSHTQGVTIAVFVLKRPIPWNRSLQKAQVVVYWDRGNIAKDAERFENEYVPHLLEIVFHDRLVIDELVKNPDYEHLMDVILENHLAVLTLGSSFR
ncbi:BglG family transcription antiterminator [Holdemania massiliensis]|uniref:BglG family transcription antiterminator n=1 Tax=Holdemania massiliensis TaxID=1468449 RepID=UPI003569261B